MDVLCVFYAFVQCLGCLLQKYAAKEARLPLVLQNTPSGTSVQNLAHWVRACFVREGWAFLYSLRVGVQCFGCLFFWYAANKTGLLLYLQSAVYGIVYGNVYGIVYGTVYGTAYGYTIYGVAPAPAISFVYSVGEGLL